MSLGNRSWTLGNLIEASVIIGAAILVAPRVARYFSGSDFRAPLYAPLGFSIPQGVSTVGQLDDLIFDWDKKGAPADYSRAFGIDETEFSRHLNRLGARLYGRDGEWFVEITKKDIDSARKSLLSIVDSFESREMRLYVGSPYLVTKQVRAKDRFHYE